MKFEILSSKHIDPLLEFELKNKLWFETFIEPRASNFYSKHGVTEHIDVLVEHMNAGTAFCAVLKQENEIVARANLRDISNNRAYIGYRVAEHFTSQGIASYCLSQLIEIAKNKLQLTTLRAQVLDNNPASKRVLKKYGFTFVGTIPKFLFLNNQHLDCKEFELKLT